jgi:hypothetical protein
MGGSESINEHYRMSWRRCGLRQLTSSSRRSAHLPFGARRRSGAPARSGLCWALALGDDADHVRSEAARIIAARPTAINLESGSSGR